MQRRRQTPKKKRMLARVAERFSAMAAVRGGVVEGGYGLWICGVVDRGVLLESLP